MTCNPFVNYQDKKKFKICHSRIHIFLKGNLANGRTIKKIQLSWEFYVHVNCLKFRWENYKWKCNYSLDITYMGKKKFHNLFYILDEIFCSTYGKHEGGWFYWC